MFKPHDLAILSKALADGLVDVAQFSDILHKLADDPDSSLEMLLSSVGLSQDQVSALIASTDDQPALTTLPATDQRAVPEAELGETATYLPDSGSPEGAAALLPALSEAADSQIAAVDQVSRQSGVHLDAQLRFRIEEELGRGGLGRVTRARDLYLGRDVAIKEMLPGATPTVTRIERFFVEAQLTGQLDHPGIVPVHALGSTHDGQPFYAMKLIEGRTLARLIDEYHGSKQPDPQRTASYHAMLRALIDACNASGFAHSHGVIHRDIKPPNIMVGDYGETLLVDWGLAKMYRESETKKRQQEAAVEFGSSTASFSSRFSSSRRLREETRLGTVLGTLAYMSPEQARGAGEAIDHRADVFSLGATLYTILTGQPPYLGNRDRQLELARLGQFPRPRDVAGQVPRALEAICLKALAFAPDDRYDSAKQLGEEIARWQSGEPVDAYPEPWWDRAGRWVRKHRTFSVSVAVGVLVAALALGGWSVQRGRQIAAARESARLALEDAQKDFYANNLSVALKRFRDVQQDAARHGLPQFESLAEGWVNKTATAIQDRENARRRWEEFRKLCADAEFYGMLATGVDIEENLRRTKESVVKALRLFSLRPEDNTRPRLDPVQYSADQRRKIDTACRRLHWIYADAVAEPLPARSKGENRRAAREALALLERTKMEDTSPKAYHLRRAYYLHLAGDEPGAQDALRQAEEEKPRHAEDHFLLGDFLYRGGQYEAAAESFRRALVAAPDHFWARYFLSAALAQLGQWEEARTHLSTLMQQRKDFIYLYLLRGFAHAELGELAAADADFSRAQEIDKNQYGMYLNRGTSRLRRGKLQEAVADFQKAIELAPESIQAYLKLSDAYCEQKDFQQALATLDEFTRLSPNSARPYFRRAQIHLAQEDRSAALEELQKGIDRADRFTPLRAALYAEQGRILHLQGETEKALQAYDLAIRECKQYYDTYRLRAIALAELNRDQEAIQAFDVYLDNTPLLDYVYAPGKAAHLGIAVSTGLSPAEKAAFGSASLAAGGTADEEAPKRHLAIVYRERGLARLKLGDSAGAMKDFLQATALVGDAAAVPMPYDRNRFGLMRARSGWLYLLHGKELALEEFDASIKITPFNGELYTGRGYAYVLLGRYREGIADAEKAIDLGPAHPGLYFNVAGIYAEAYARAKADEKAADREAVAKTCGEKAVRALRNCLEQWPESRETYLREARRDPALDPIRDREEFKQLLKEFST